MSEHHHTSAGSESAARWPAPGDRMRFLGANGYPDQLKRALKTFEVGEEYEVEACDVGDWSHSIRFKGVDGWHNGVMFERVLVPTPAQAALNPPPLEAIAAELGVSSPYDMRSWAAFHGAFRKALAVQPPAAPVEECANCHGDGYFPGRDSDVKCGPCGGTGIAPSSAGTTDAGCGAAVITPWAVEGSSRDWFGDLNERIGKGLNAPLEPSADNGDQRTEDGGSLVDRLRGRAAYLRNIGEVKSPELMEKAANALKPSARCACVDPYENCEFPDCPQGEDHAETPARAATPDGVENLRAILNDQPYLNSALSVHEIKVILANEGGFMPDEAVLWFRTARGNLGSPLSRPHQRGGS